MMFAVYFVLGWSLVGCVAALLMGRAIAICAHDRDATPSDVERTVGATARKDLPTAKAA